MKNLTRENHTRKLQHYKTLACRWMVWNLERRIGVGGFFGGTCGSLLDRSMIYLVIPGVVPQKVRHISKQKDQVK